MGYSTRNAGGEVCRLHPCTTPASAPVPLLQGGGSDARRDWIVQLTSSALLFQSVPRSARICWTSCLTFRWAPYRCAVILASMDSQVLSDIQARLNLSRRGELGIWALSSEYSLSGDDARSHRKGLRGERCALCR